jgi:hypothetical protein
VGHGIDGDAGDMVVVERVSDLAATPAAGHQPLTPQDPQVLGDERLGDTQGRDQLVDALLVVSEAEHDRQPVRVRQGPQQIRGCGHVRCVERASTVSSGSVIMHARHDVICEYVHANGCAHLMRTVLDALGDWARVRRWFENRSQLTPVIEELAPWHDGTGVRMPGAIVVVFARRP